jgi:PKD repeat protein/glucose/arabinose dehydrogenase
MPALRSLLLAVLILVALPAGASAIVPPGFQETTAFSGLTAPTSVRFADDGRVFVAEKRGRVLEYESLSDTTPTVFADLSTAVHDFWDRGLLGMALDPDFTNGRPYIYVLYTYNKDPSSATFPRWDDSCPTPPGATGDGCVVSGRLSRLQASGVETPLITDWCQQYPSHSVGDLVFGPGRALYVSAGDGASFNFPDYGQDGSPVNPCGDPPGGIGGSMTAPTAEGGALRSQDVRTAGDPTSGDGTILRVDPDTGAALPDNPSAGSSDPMTRRIVAHGFRNPFRMTIRPGTGEVWSGDVGWNEWEEINRTAAPTAGMTNHGWPCYEGNGRMSSYDNLNLSLCETLYSQGAGAHTTPHYTYRHADKVIAGEACPSGTSSVAGLAFYTGPTFPARYRDGLFFADYSRSCIWFMPKGANGLPDPSQRESFASGMTGIVNLVQGPDGSLYYPNLNNGTVRRISFGTPNSAPTARASANPTSGAVPLSVQFDGTASSDPNGGTLTYAWDLDGDGAFDDATGAQPTRTYTTPGVVAAKLRVTDPGGLESTATVTITAGSPPDARIDTPVAGTTWTVGDQLSFAGGATDWQGAALPASRLSWKLLLEHCGAGGVDCHTHTVQSWNGVASASFIAPDHEYPSHLELELTATDANGLTDVMTRRLDPKTVNLTFETAPAGLELSVGSFSGAAPFTRTVIAGSTQGISAPAPQTLGGRTYTFSSWSDGGAQDHTITAPASAATYRATFTEVQALPGLVGAWGFNEASGGQAVDASGRANHGTLSGAARTASGRFGGALTFDGLDDWVTVADAASLDLTTGMTMEAWVNPSALGSNWRTAVIKEAPPGALAYALYASEGTPRASGHVNTGTESDVRSPAAIPLNSWTHLTTTYDGSTLRLYVGGLLVTSKAVTGALVTSTGALRFGGNAIWNEWFQGRIDEVRIYNRALSAAEVASDMSTPVGGGSPAAPRLAVAPGSLSFSGTQGGANPAAKTLAVSNAGSGALSFAATDDAPWLSVTPGSGSAPQDLSVTASTAGLAPGTYNATVTVTAPGADDSPATVPVTLTVADQPPPPALAVAPASLSFAATVGGGAPAGKTLDVTNTGSGTLSFNASDDAAWLSVAPASGNAPQTVAVTASPAGLTAGTYTATVTIAAAGAAGSPKSVPVTFTVTDPPAPSAGLVAAYGFDETSGTTVADASGTGNPGVISGATRTASGRSGGALTFDGINDWVTVADAASLDLTTGMTLEAWVNPSALGSAWRTVILKEQSTGMAYGLYADEGGNRPSAHVYTSSELDTRGTAALPVGAWSHLAATYDGTTLRLFVNGTQVSSRAVAGAMRVTAQSLRIGGNAVWNEWFQGRIDEVRIYNRALPAADIQADMARPVGAVSLAARTAKQRASRAFVKRQLRRAKRHASVRRERARRHLPLKSHKLRRR